MNIGQAIDLLKNGHRVSRAGMDGWLCFMPPTVIPEGLVNGRTKRFVPSGDLHVGGYIVMMTARGVWQPGWAASQEDLLANDWEVLPDEMGRAPGEPAA